MNNRWLSWPLDWLHFGTGAGAVFGFPALYYRYDSTSAVSFLQSLQNVQILVGDLVQDNSATNAGFRGNCSALI